MTTITTTGRAEIAAAASPRTAMASLLLAMLLSSLGTSIANVGLPRLAETFGASFHDVQWVVLAYLLAVTTLIVSVGRLGDLFGRRRLLLGGIALFTVASILCGLAPSLPLLIAARAAQGLGAAVMMALALAFVGDTVAKARIGRAMGLLGAMSAVGTALGPSLGGLLIAGLGWRAIFLVSVPLGVAAFGLAWRGLPADRPRRDGARFDVTGTVLLAVALGAYALSMTTGRGGFGVVNLLLLGGAVVVAGLFVRAQARTVSPLVPLATFRNPVLSAGFVMSLLVATVIMVTFVVGPFYLAGALALDPGRVGLVMSVGPLVSVVGGVPAGRLVDRMGARRMTVVGLVGMASGAALLAMVPVGFGIPGYIAPLLLLTGGYALFQAANNTAVMADVPAERRGVISGMLSLSRNLGLVTGASVMGAVFALGAGTADIVAAGPDAVARGMHLTFGVAAGLMLAALFVATTLVARTRDRGDSRTR